MSLAQGKQRLWSMAFRKKNESLCLWSRHISAKQFELNHNCLEQFITRYDGLGFFHAKLKLDV